VEGTYAPRSRNKNRSPIRATLKTTGRRTQNQNEMFSELSRPKALSTNSRGARSKVKSSSWRGDSENKTSRREKKKCGDGQGYPKKGTIGPSTKLFRESDDEAGKIDEEQTSPKGKPKGPSLAESTDGREVARTTGGGSAAQDGNELNNNFFDGVDRSARIRNKLLHEGMLKKPQTD